MEHDEFCTKLWIAVEAESESLDETLDDEDGEEGDFEGFILTIPLHQIGTETSVNLCIEGGSAVGVSLASEEHERKLLEALEEAFKEWHFHLVLYTQEDLDDGTVSAEIFRAEPWLNEKLIERERESEQLREEHCDDLINLIEDTFGSTFVV